MKLLKRKSTKGREEIGCVSISFGLVYYPKIRKSLANKKMPLFKDSNLIK
jgi:hypothetical protein